MNWVNRLQKMIDYIEENIMIDIEMNTLAKMMHCSKHDFQRIFAYLVGLPLSEYIKNRRLTLAGEDIRNAKEKIIDISLKYGYESHSSFSRSFREFHGITPSEVRKNPELLLTEYPIFSIYQLLED